MIACLSSLAFAEPCCQIGLLLREAQQTSSPEKVLQVLCSVRSERQRMGRVQYNLLFRWLIGLSMDDEVWVPSLFTENRERLIEHDAVIEFFNEVLKIADNKQWLSGEHFSVDGTFIQAWAGHKSFVRKGDDDASGDDRDGNGDNTDDGHGADTKAHIDGGNFKGQRRSNDTHESTTDRGLAVPQRQNRQRAATWDTP